MDLHLLHFDVPEGLFLLEADLLPELGLVAEVLALEEVYLGAPFVAHLSPLNLGYLDDPSFLLKTPVLQLKLFDVAH